MASLCFRISVALVTSSLATIHPPPAQASPVQAQASSLTEVAAPLSIPPDGDWDGIDGSWSSFTLRVGTPAQDVRVFLSWASYQTWVVLLQGCSSASDVNSCTGLRGGTFNPTSSSTWDQLGYYFLDIEEDLGYNGDGLFGYDTVGLGSNSTGLPSLSNTTVGGVALVDYYIGVFGINPLSTNFTTLKDSSPSYLSLLKTSKQIPSLSFGYTAGAIYRGSGVFGSLTLGGYDKSKILESTVEFSLSASYRGGTIAALKSISTPSQISSGANPIELLSDPIFVTLDATVPQIWLPVQVCQAFEEEFGIVYDNTTDLYLVNSTQQAALLQRNSSVTLELSSSMKDGQSVSITLPYAAFDLTAQPPYQGISANASYFPLRRALNDDQITLGRAFFQEAYITVDFERQVYSLSHVNWDTGASQDLVAIQPYNGSNASNSSKSGDALSGGEIAGIVTGVVALSAIIALVFTWIWRRRGAHIEAKAAKTSEQSTPAEDSPRIVSEKQQPQISVRPDKTVIDLPPASRDLDPPAFAPRENMHFRSGSGSPCTVRSGTQSPLRQVSNAHDPDPPSNNAARTSISRRDAASGAVTATTSTTHTPTGRRSPAIHASGARVSPSNRSLMIKNSVEGRSESGIGAIETLSRVPPPAAENTLAISSSKSADEGERGNDDSDPPSAMAPPDIERHPRRSESLQGRLRRSLERRNSASSAKSAATATSKTSRTGDQGYYTLDDHGRYSNTHDPAATSAAADPALLTALPAIPSTTTNPRRLRHQRSLSHDEGTAPSRSRVRFLESNDSGEFVPIERPTSLWSANHATPGNPIFTRSGSSNGRASPIGGIATTMEGGGRSRPAAATGGPVRRNSTGRASLVGVETTTSAKLETTNESYLDMTDLRVETRTPPPKPAEAPAISRRNSSGRSSLIGIDFS